MAKKGAKKTITFHILQNPPPPQKKKKKKQTKKQTKKNKEGLGKNKKIKQNKKNKKYQKMSFSVISQKFIVFCWVSKKSLFLTTWPRKRAPPKHYKNRGFSTPILGKQFCVTKRPFLDKKTQIHKFQLSFFTKRNTIIC